MTFVKEAQIKIATTTLGEVCYWKIPGRESMRVGAKRCPYDFRPTCPGSVYSYYATKDVTATEIFGAMAHLVDKYPEYTDIIIAIFAPLENLQFEKKSMDVDVEVIKPEKKWANMMMKKEPVSHLYHSKYSVVGTYKHHLELYHADHPVELWKVANEVFDMSGTAFEGFSIQMFFYITEGVVMNEDSKMSYLKKNGLLNDSKKPVHVGRSNTIRSMMADVCFARGGMPVTDISAVTSNIARMSGMRPVPLYAIRNLAPEIITVSDEMIAEDMKRFKKSTAKDVFPEGVYQMFKKATNLYGEVSATIEALKGRCILKAGSIISPTCKADITRMASTLREGIPMDDNGLVTEDIVLDVAKPACVGTVVAGRNIASQDDWKTPEGKTLRECRK